MNRVRISSVYSSRLSNCHFDLSRDYQNAKLGIPNDLKFILKTYHVHINVYIEMLHVHAPLHNILLDKGQDDS